MVLFDEDPVSLITETTNQFHITPDKEALARISSSLSALAFNRCSRLDAQHGTMKALSRRLHTIKSQHEYEQAKRDTGRHASEILALDGEKFRIAKTVNEIEVEGERLSSEIASLKRALDQLKRDGENVKDDDSDVTVLKLQVYRSMGIDLGAGKAAVRNGKNLTIIDLKGEGTQTNHVWECLR